jgi:N-acetyltransferase
MKIEFEKEIILENQRCLLRPVQPGDSELLWPVANDPELWKIALSKISDKTSFEGYIKTALQERADKISFPFLIFDKQVNKAAGSTRFSNFSLVHERVEIGWTWLGTEFQKTGLNRACKRLLLEFAFETMKANRVELKTDLLNLNSQAAMEKIGAVKEAVLRKHLITETGRHRDSVYYSILQSEWPVIKTNNLKNAG